MSELHGLQTRITEFQQAGATVVAVSPDSPEENRGVVERLGLGFPILSDEDLALTRSLGLLHEQGGPAGQDIPRPAIFIVDDGTIRWSELTDNWRVRVQAGSLLAAVEQTLGS